MRDYIAKTDLDFVSLKDQTRYPSTVYISKPEEADRCWECKVTFSGVENLTRKAYGDDSMQALCLAVKLLEIELMYFKKNAYKIFFSDSDIEFPLKAFFPLNDEGWPKINS